MKALDSILREEMLEEDIADIMSMDNENIDGFYPSEDEKFCQAILDDPMSGEEDGITTGVGLNFETEKED